MGWFSRKPKEPEEPKEQGPPNVISLDGLPEPTPVEITDDLRDQMNQLGRDSFPDDEGLGFAAQRVVSSGGKIYAEIVPSEPNGYDGYVFVVNRDGELEACYCLEDGAYSLLFT